MSGPAHKYDLVVVYRIYPKVSKPALGLFLSDNKERMAEICLQSFRRSLGNLHAKLWGSFLMAALLTTQRCFASFLRLKTSSWSFCQA